MNAKSLIAALTTVVSVLGLSACASGPTAVGGAVDRIGTLITPYKVEIIQGNVLTKEQVALLQKGMSREQVRSVLGSPLVTSAFHGDRWDYVFTIERQGIAAQERRYKVLFKGDLLDDFGGDPMPAENEFAAGLVTRKNFGTPPNLTASEAQLKGFAANNNRVSVAKAPVDASSASARTDYPPLEGASLK